MSVEAAVAILWLYSTFTVFWLLRWWLGRHIQGVALLVWGQAQTASTLYFWLLAPGVVLHELSHWLVAKILLVPTKDLVLFRAPQGKREQGGAVTLGYVEIFRTDPIRQSLIGFAPLPVGVLILLLLAALLDFETGISQTHYNTWQSIVDLPSQVLVSVRSPLNFLWLYFVFSISNGMLPSEQDRKPWLIGFLLPGIIVLLLALTGQLPPLPFDWQQNLLRLIHDLTWIFAFAAIVNFSLAALIFLLEQLLSRMKQRRVIYK